MKAMSDAASRNRATAPTWLPATISTEFRRKAAELQIPVSVLATKLLSAIVVSNIYEAVLDDGDESYPALSSAA